MKRSKFVIIVVNFITFILKTQFILLDGKTRLFIFEIWYTHFWCACILKKNYPLRIVLTRLSYLFWLLFYFKLYCKYVCKIRGARGRVVQVICISTLWVWVQQETLDYFMSGRFQLLYVTSVVLRYPFMPAWNNAKRDTWGRP
jgi:hypothetical protein